MARRRGAGWLPAWPGWLVGLTLAAAGCDVAGALPASPVAARSSPAPTVTALARALEPAGSAAATSAPSAPAPAATSPAVRLGIDELRASGFALLRGRKVGVLTNHTGLGSDGRRTIDVLREADGVELVAILSPEHGLAGSADGPVGSSRDEPSGLAVRSLYGAHQRPTAADLAGIDTVVFDLQDVGVRFYTFETTLLYLLEEAARLRLRVVVLDRPNPLDGVSIEGPVLDAGRSSFVGYFELPVRHGLTIGELGRLFVAERGLTVDLRVVPMTGWRRASRFDATGLVWQPTSPNIRTLDQALLYSGIGLLEATNLSVGRGTDHPFELVGAPWLDASALVADLAAAPLAGVSFAAVDFTPAASTFAGELCHGIAMTITNRDLLRPVRVGLELATRLRARHRDRWRAERMRAQLGDEPTLAALLAGEPAEQIAASWQPELAAFVARRRPHLLYPETSPVSPP